nr:collagen alpha-4(VI) chain-like [Biomphalaria glabrata]
MRLLLSCLFCFLVLTEECIGLSVQSSLTCNQIDFLVLVDTTTYTGKVNSDMYIKSFLKQVIVTHGSSPEPLDTQVGVILTRNCLYFEFNLRSYKSVNDALKAVEQIKYESWDGATVRYKTLSTYGFRAQSSKNVIVVTDGVSGYSLRTTEIAEFLKGQGLNIFAIGLGHNANYNMLQAMASSSSQQFKVRNFNSPRCIKIILTRTTCRGSTVNKTTSLTKVTPKYTRTPKIIKMKETTTEDYYVEPN